MVTLTAPFSVMCNPLCPVARRDPETPDTIDIDDENTRTTTAAERKILTTMQCGCHAPVGAYAEIIGGEIHIRAFISDLQGENFISRKITGPVVDAENLAEKIAKELLDAGGKEILASLEK